MYAKEKEDEKKRKKWYSRLQCDCVTEGIEDSSIMKRLRRRQPEVVSAVL